jgi:CTP:molybdopterin cytidylyltransferase MocA
MADKRIAAIILAAGASTRLGQPKQLVEYEGEPLVQRAAIAARHAGAAPVLVVLGSNADRISPVLERLPDVRTIHNANWESGLSSSLSTGLAVLTEYPEIDGAMIVLADQPLVDAAALRSLVEAFGGSRVVASSYADTIGAPAIIGHEYFEELSQLEGDRGAGAWLRSRKVEVTVIPLTSPALDIDTSDDLDKLKTIDQLQERIES